MIYAHCNIWDILIVPITVIAVQMASVISLHLVHDANYRINSHLP